MITQKYEINSKAYAHLQMHPYENAENIFYRESDTDGVINIEKISRSKTGAKVLGSFQVDQCTIAESLSFVHETFHYAMPHLYPIELGVNCSQWLLGRHYLIPNEVISLGNDSFLRENFRCIFSILDAETTSAADFLRLNYGVKIKIFEVVADQIRDLILSSGHTGGRERADRVRIREHPTTGAYIHGLEESECISADDAFDLVHKAYVERSTLVAEMLPAGRDGSRSYEVIGYVGNLFIQVDIEQTLISHTTSDSSQPIVRRSGTLQFNILADSEALSFKSRASKSGPASSLSVVSLNTARELTTCGERTIISPGNSPAGFDLILPHSQLSVGAKALTTLSRVITALDRQHHQLNREHSLDGSVTAPDEDSLVGHIPYRDSVLTRILRPSLEGNTVNSVCVFADTRRDSTLYISNCLRMMSHIRNGIVSTVVSRDVFSAVTDADRKLMIDAIDKRRAKYNFPLGESENLEHVVVSEEASSVLSAFIGLNVDTAADAGKINMTENQSNIMAARPFDPTDSPGQILRKGHVYSAYGVGKGDTQRQAIQAVRSLTSYETHKEIDSTAAVANCVESELAINSKDFWKLFAALSKESMMTHHITSLRELEKEREKLLSTLAVKICESDQIVSSVIPSLSQGNCSTEEELTDSETSTTASNADLSLAMITSPGCSFDGCSTSNQKFVVTSDRKMVGRATNTLLPKIVSSTKKTQLLDGDAGRVRRTSSLSVSVDARDSNLSSYHPDAIADGDAIPPTSSVRTGPAMLGSGRLLSPFTIDTPLSAVTAPSNRVGNGKAQHVDTTLGGSSSSSILPAVSSKSPRNKGSREKKLLLSSHRSTEGEVTLYNTERRQGKFDTSTTRHHPTTEDSTRPAQGSPMKSTTVQSLLLPPTRSPPALFTSVASMHSPMKSSPTKMIDAFGIPAADTNAPKLALLSDVPNPIRQYQLLSSTSMNRSRSSSPSMIDLTASRTQSRPHSDSYLPMGTDAESSPTPSRKSISVKMPKTTSAVQLREMAEFGIGESGSSGLSELEERFFRAIGKDDVKMVKRCIEEGVDVNARNSFGRSGYAVFVFCM